MRIDSKQLRFLVFAAWLALFVVPSYPLWVEMVGLGLLVIGYFGFEQYDQRQQTRRDAATRARTLSLRKALYCEPDGTDERDAQAPADGSSRSVQIAQVADLDPRRALSAWSRLRSSGELPDPETADQVLGVVLESGREVSPRFFAAYADGYVKIAYTDGETVRIDPAEEGPIGSLARPIQSPAQALVAAAQPLVGEFPPEENRALPAVGQVRVALLTPGGVRVREMSESSFAEQDRQLQSILRESNDLESEITNIAERAGQPHLFQDAPGRGREGEYADALIAVLSDNPSNSVELMEDQPLPALESLAQGFEMQEWCRKQGLPYQELSARNVIQLYLALPLRWSFLMRKGKVFWKVAREGYYPTPYQVTFEKLGSRKDQGRGLRITVDPVPGK